MQASFWGVIRCSLFKKKVVPVPGLRGWTHVTFSDTQHNDCQYGVFRDCKHVRLSLSHTCIDLLSGQTVDISMHCGESPLTRPKETWLPEEFCFQGLLRLLLKPVSYTDCCVSSSELHHCWEHYVNETWQRGERQSQQVKRRKAHFPCEARQNCSKPLI